MVDGRKTTPADRMRTALTFRYADRAWRGKPGAAKKPKPVEHRLYPAYLDGTHVPKDGPGSVIADLEQSIPEAVRIFRSPLWVLLQGKELNADDLRRPIEDGGMGFLGEEFRDLAEIERLVIQTEIDLHLHSPSIGEARIEDTRRRVTYLGLPSILGEFAEQFGKLLGEQIARWHAKLVRLREYEALSRSLPYRSEHTCDHREAICEPGAPESAPAMVHSHASKQPIDVHPRWRWMLALDRRHSALVSVLLLVCWIVVRDPFVEVFTAILFALNAACAKWRWVFDYPRALEA